MKNRINKKGVIGSFTTTFVAIIIVAILVTMFILSAAYLKSLTGIDSGEVVFQEDSLGLEDGVGYMNNYIKLVDAKSRVGDELSLDEALLEVNYGEE